MRANRSVAGDSATVALWTGVSRVTGFARGAVIAAVLGPTYFGNTFQATNILPNLTYELLTGSLFASLLMPSLVRHVDTDDSASARRVAGGFLGAAILGFLALVALVLIAGPLVLRVLTLGVTSAEVGRSQRRVGFILLALLMPQVVLYGIAGTSGAVMNAKGKFALAAAAPSFENLGMIVTLLVFRFAYGTAPDLDTVTTGQLLLLGLGTTAAVGCHAGFLWFGTWRVGLPIRPRAGWRDPEVRELLRAVVPSLGYAGLNVARLFTVLVVANRVPGGVVAFQLALNFFYLPVAVGARPIAVALLPRLARLYRDRALAAFRSEFVRGLAICLFVTIPAGVAYGALALPLARAIAFGEMATPTGRHLVSISLAALAAGVVGESAFVMATHASYACEDRISPFRSSLVRTGIVLAGMSVAFARSGASVLVVLGLAVSISNLVGAVDLGVRLRRRLPSSGERLGPALWRSSVAAAAMAVPAYVVARAVPDVVPSRAGYVVAAGLAAVVGAGAYLGVQWLWRAPELDWFRGVARRGGAAAAA